LTLAELAKIMLEIGCIGAINLDGGGSSSLVIDGYTTIRPSNANAAERAVVSALIVKKR
jgi:exopolysaccharide biosynthesis protein